MRISQRRSIAGSCSTSARALASSSNAMSFQVGHSLDQRIKSAVDRDNHSTQFGHPCSYPCSYLGTLLVDPGIRLIDPGIHLVDAGSHVTHLPPCKPEKTNRYHCQ